MNVDKFGHHVHKRLRLIDYLDVINDSLVKSDTGHYDLKQNRLLGLPAPVFDDEATSKQFVEHTLKKYFTKNEFDINVKNTVNISLQEFKNKLDKIIGANYYTKSEIDLMLKKRAPLPQNE